MPNAQCPMPNALSPLGQFALIHWSGLRMRGAE